MARKLSNTHRLLAALESLSAGLTRRDRIENSSCFTFENGNISTFNDEVACVIKNPIAEFPINGAVPAAPLLTLLRSQADQDVEFYMEDHNFVLFSQGEKAALPLKPTTDDIKKIERPRKWKKLPNDFTDAIAHTRQSFSRDESNYDLTCVHIHPRFIESCDNHQFVRYLIDTNFSTRCLVRGASLRRLIGLNMTEFAESDNWLHFRNATGLMLSLRRGTQEYLSMENELNMRGRRIKLPQRLAEVVRAAAVAVSSKKDNDDLLVKLSPGKMLVEGQKDESRRYKHKFQLRYRGPELGFLVSPRLLAAMAERFTDCEVEVCERLLRVETEKVVYLLATGEPTKQRNGRPAARSAKNVKRASPRSNAVPA